MELEHPVTGKAVEHISRKNRKVRQVRGLESTIWVWVWQIWVMIRSFPVRNERLLVAERWFGAFWNWKKERFELCAFIDCIYSRMNAYIHGYLPLALFILSAFRLDRLMARPRSWSFFSLVFSFLWRNLSLYSPRQIYIIVGSCKCSFVRPTTHSLSL